VDADVLFINSTNRSVYLPHRKAKPLEGLWFVGGRIYAGEPALEGIVRLVKRETGIDVTPERFEYIQMNRYVWTTREQVPQNKGSDNLCYVFALEITNEERITASQHLDSKEYDTAYGLQEYTKEMLEQEGVHRAVLHIYNTVFGTKK
jgi:hypothetical protein